MAKRECRAQQPVDAFYIGHDNNGNSFVPSNSMVEFMASMFKNKIDDAYNNGIPDPAGHEKQ